MNKEVSFPLAKLLKEKGFDKYGYLQDVWLGNKYEWIGKGKNKRSVEIPVFGLGSSSVLPTIAEVVMWLYEKHGIWISVQPTSVVGKFQFRTYYNNNGVMNQHWNNSMSKEFKSPTEAYEAAIIYTLNNLI